MTERNGDNEINGAYKQIERLDYMIMTKEVAILNTKSKKKYYPASPMAS